jgi:hypothetical protein
MCILLIHFHRLLLFLLNFVQNHCLHQLEEVSSLRPPVAHMDRGQFLNPTSISNQTAIPLSHSLIFSQVDYTTVFIFRLLMFVDNGLAAGMGL